MFEQKSEGYEFHFSWGHFDLRGDWKRKRGAGKPASHAAVKRTRCEVRVSDWSGMNKDGEK